MAEIEEGIMMVVRDRLRDAQEKLHAADYDAAMALAHEALDKALNQNHNPSIAAAYYGIASLIWASGGDSAKAHYYAGLAAQNTKANTQTDLLVRTLVARIKAARGNYEAAILLNEDLLRYYFETNDYSGMANVLRSLGDVYFSMGNYAKATERYHESLRLYTNDLQEPLNHAGVLVSYGSLMYQRSDTQQAEAYWDEAQRIAEAHGFRHIIEGLDSARRDLNEG
ncbi:MAG: tetratricopeptide repeat protein [Anaerolineales bacterium]